MNTARKYLTVLGSALVGLAALILRPVLTRVDAYIYDVDNVLSGFTKLQNRLDKSATKALAKGDACVDRANVFNEQADEAYEAAERAHRAKMRLSKLLD